MYVNETHMSTIGISQISQIDRELVCTPYSGVLGYQCSELRNMSTPSTPELAD
jgi:hypothetical protein